MGPRYVLTSVRLDFLIVALSVLELLLPLVGIKLSFGQLACPVPCPCPCPCASRTLPPTFTRRSAAVRSAAVRGVADQQG